MACPPHPTSLGATWQAGLFEATLDEALRQVDADLQLLQDAQPEDTDALVLTGKLRVRRAGRDEMTQPAGAQLEALWRSTDRMLPRRCKAANGANEVDGAVEEGSGRKATRLLCSTARPRTRIRPLLYRT